MTNKYDVDVSYQLAEPINKAIAEINKIFFDSELFDKEYHKYLLEQNRLGQKVDIRNFIESILENIQRIWDGTIGIENNYKEDGIEIKLHSVFNQLRDVRKNAENRISEIEQKIDKSNTNLNVSDILSFDSSYETQSLSEILPNVHIDQFIRMEKELLARKFLYENCIWVSLPVELAVFIETLYRKSFFKKFLGKTEQSKRSLIRRFFEKRYKKEISDQFKPSNLTEKVFNRYSATFFFLKEFE